MKKIIRGDQVIVIAGKYKGKTGKVLKVLADDRVIVSGTNLVTKHVKPNPMAGITGGKVEKEAPLNVSNIAILNSETKKADRVGFKIENCKKVRIYKSTKAVIANNSKE